MSGNERRSGAGIESAGATLGCKERGPSTLRTADVYARIYAVVTQIPIGKVASYGQIARMEGHCGPRMVGYAMRIVPDHITVPWQRVVNSAGKLSQRSGGGGTHRQMQLLRDEGVVFSATGRVDFDRFGWLGPEPDWLLDNGFQPALPPA